MKGRRNLGARAALAAAIALVALGGGLGVKSFFGPRPIVITGDNPTLGDPSSPITIYEFADYG